MQRKIYTALIIASISSLPMIASAGEDFVITNNTDSYGTVSIGYAPCSSTIGSDGVVKPHEVHTFSHNLMKIFCGSSCTVTLYPNEHCSGKPIGSAKIDSKVGVVSYENKDEEHYRVSGSGFNFTIDQVGNWLRSWFKKFV